MTSVLEEKIMEDTSEFICCARRSAYGLERERLPHSVLEGQVRRFQQWPHVPVTMPSMDGATEERRGFHRLFGFSFEEEPGGGETASLAGLDAKPAGMG